MNTHFTKILPTGEVYFTEPQPEPRSDYSETPIQFAFLRDSKAIEIHGENFSVEVKMTTDQLLDLAQLLIYAAREWPFCSQPAKASPGQ
jgi:hypothetical protein